MLKPLENIIKLLEIYYKSIDRVATRSCSSGKDLEEKKMFLKFEIAKSVIELIKIYFRKYIEDT